MNKLHDKKLTQIALEAVLTGASIAETVSAASQVVSHKGSLRDIVTVADLQISGILEQKLCASGLPVVSEESYDSTVSVADEFWVVDPIDGSVNFSHGLAQFAISAGLVRALEFPLGVVCAPSLNELYFTLSPQSAMLNGRPFVHEHHSVNDTLAASSFSARASATQYELFRQVNESTCGCLRTGSAALNLCWVAVGKLQAAYGFHAKLWDVAGGLAVAKAAGCETKLRVNPDSFTVDYIVGSRDAVRHITNLAQDIQLWDENNG